MLVTGSIGPGPGGDGGAAGPGPIAGATERIAGSRFGFVAMNSGELRLFTPTGALVRRVWRTDGGSPAPFGHHGRAYPRGTEGTIEEQGEMLGAPHGDAALATGALSIASVTAGELADADGINLMDLDELEDDDLREVRRRPWRSPARPLGDDRGGAGVATVAVGDRHAWIGRGDGLWRLGLDDDVLIREILGSQGVTAVAASADGRVVAAVASGHLERSMDGGDTFTRGAELSGRTRNIAACSTGAILFWDDSGPRLAVPGGVGAQPVDEHLPRIVQDAIACGEHFAVVAENRVVDFDPQLSPPTGPPVALPVGARRVLCLSGDTRIAYGDGIWTTADRGTHWTPRDSAGPGAIRTMTRVGEFLWSGTSSGIWALPVTAVAASSRAPSGDASAARRTARSTMPAGLSGYGSAGVRLWRMFLPRVSASFAAWQAPDHASLVGLVTATFTLDPTPLARATRDRLTSVYVDRQLEWLDAARHVQPASPSDPIILEEEQALARMWGDHGENSARDLGGSP
jgi:hypothetical protein